MEIILIYGIHKTYPDFELCEQAIHFTAITTKRYINQGVKFGLYANDKDVLADKSIHVPGWEFKSDVQNISVSVLYR